MNEPHFTGYNMLVGKDTNPKDAIATNKVPLDLVPPITQVYASLGHLEGALKYGKWNWRISGVKASVYIGALKRHIAKYESGEEVSKEGVPHLANALACIGILLDAKLVGKLNDDRPPRSVELVEAMDLMEEDVARLRERFKDCAPKHYSIADSPEKS